MASAMGADAVGFVFAPSTRRIQPTLARDIARRLTPEVLTVGVFRDETPQRVVEVVNAAGLRAAQLHGFESVAEVDWVRKRVPFVIKAFTAGHPLLDKVHEYDVDAVLLDASNPGSGEVFDWSLVAGLSQHVRLILAGGLRVDNVTDAIERVGPWGVDVSTGVESAPGHKDVRLVRRFINAAKADDDSHFLDAAPVPLLPAEFDPAPFEGAMPASGGAQRELYDWDGDVSS